MKDRITNKKLLLVAFLVVLIVPAAGCDSSESLVHVNLSRRAPVPAHVRGQRGRPSLRIAVGGMVTPKTAFGYYRQFFDYIGDELGMHIDFVDRENYAEINELVKTGTVDVAFVCGGPYVDGHDEFGMELLVAPQVHGKQVYYSYIIVSKDSPAGSLADLRGKTFAFTDPLSNSGALVPTYLLARMHAAPDTFFKKVFFTRSHDKSIKAVAREVVDGAAVDSLIWEFENRLDPTFTSRTKIVSRSKPYGIPPVVVRKGLDPRLKERLRDIFLGAHHSRRGRRILSGMMIDRFMPITDGAYDSIREMKRWVAVQGGGRRTAKP